MIGRAAAAAALPHRADTGEHYTVELVQAEPVTVEALSTAFGDVREVRSEPEQPRELVWSRLDRGAGPSTVALIARMPEATAAADGAATQLVLRVEARAAP